MSQCIIKRLTAALFSDTANTRMVIAKRAGFAEIDVWFMNRLSRLSSTGIVIVQLFTYISFHHIMISATVFKE